MEQLQGNAGVGSVMAIVGLVLAVWSASGYVAAFIRSANAVYDMPEGRPVWKVLPVRLGVTVVLMVVAVISALIVVFTGGLARQAGTALGLGDTALTVWSIAKWPVLVLLVTIMIAILYWATPNARVKGFRWITPGSFLALVIWMIASAGFARTTRSRTVPSRRRSRPGTPRPQSRSRRPWPPHGRWPVPCARCRP
ncbi:ribonuclease BN family membrane protein [Streptomyces azureus]|uniref:Ribonuclease BN family membrane protein n=1 Tax=Streptomyces azureus TaxID=146537 RepID=A0A0K8PC48_STRAJ|nr:ribonuclease BN family membrane protein [Streptomyces azureus]